MQEALAKVELQHADDSGLTFAEKCPPLIMRFLRVRQLGGKSYYAEATNEEMGRKTKGKAGGNRRAQSTVAAARLTTSNLPVSFFQI